MEFHIDYAQDLDGHAMCGRRHSHTAKIVSKVEGNIKGGKHYRDDMIMTL
jgi:hypothetical protein